jgi:cellulose synthase/poly-beta-1,6-N-acetylglucosamine synthase-like glycosyltransferase
MSARTPTPLVSIGIPVYNGARVLRQALDHLLAQTYTHLELVICDNASTDETGAICQAYAARDTRVHYYRNPTNVGLINNYRLAVTRSSGTYFMWNAADDRKPPTAVGACVRALQAQPQAVMAHGPIMVQTAESDDLVPLANAVDLSMPDTAARIRAFTGCLTCSAMLYGLYRLEAVRQVCLGHCLGQDYLLCLQVCLLGPIVIYYERKPQPNDNPMYTVLPITLGTVLYAGRHRRRKCWTVLLRGCYELARLQRVPWLTRWRGIWAHVTTFWQRYHDRLAREIVLQGCEPLVGLSLCAWRLAHRWTTTAVLARQVHTRLKRHLKT